MAFALSLRVLSIISFLVPFTLAQAYIPTPNLTSCETTHLSWRGSKPPYSIGVLIGSTEPPTSPLYHLGNSTGKSYNWLVDLEAGTTVTVAVKGKEGNIAYSEKVIVQPGLNTTCLKKSGWNPTAKVAASVGNTTSTSSSRNRTSASVNSTASGVGPTFSTALPGATGNVSSGIGANPAAQTTSARPTSGASSNTAFLAGSTTLVSLVALAGLVLLV